MSFNISTAPGDSYLGAFCVWWLYGLFSCYKKRGIRMLVALEQLSKGQEAYHWKKKNKWSLDQLNVLSSRVAKALTTMLYSWISRKRLTRYRTLFFSVSSLLSYPLKPFLGSPTTPETVPSVSKFSLPSRRPTQFLQAFPRNLTLAHSFHSLHYRPSSHHIVWCHYWCALICQWHYSRESSRRT